MRAVFVVASLASLFLFPYPMTLALSFAATLFVPFFALVIGIYADLLYGAAIPLMTLWGLVLSLAALVVHRFVKTRIFS